FEEARSYWKLRRWSRSTPSKQGVLVLLGYAVPYNYFKMRDGFVGSTFGIEVLDAHILTILVVLACIPALATPQGKPPGKLGRIVMGVFGLLALIVAVLILANYVTGTRFSAGQAPTLRCWRP